MGGALALAGAATPPPISRHPLSQRVTAGHRVRLIGGSPSLSATFRWEKDGVAIPGMTQPELILPNVQLADAATYCLIAIDDRRVPGEPLRGEAVSRPARLDVLLPPFGPGVVDLGWADPGIDGPDVRALAVRADGSCVIGGDFTAVGGSPSGGLAALTAEGQRDLTFNSGGSGADKKVRALAPWGGGWAVGGDFTIFNGRPAARLVVVDGAGMPVPTDVFAPPALTSNVRALAVQRIGTEDRLVVGLSGAPWLMRLRSTGMVDAAFGDAVAAGGINGRVNALVVQGDGRIVLGGSFFEDGQWPFNRVGRLLPDGTPDVAADGFVHGPGTGADFEVSALALAPGGRLAVGGRFTQLHGQSRFFLGRLLANGQLDAAFDPAPNDAVNALAVDAAGRTLVAGDFSRVDGGAIRSVARLTAAGGRDPGWFPPAIDGAALAVGLAEAGQVVVAGTFGQPHQRVVRLRAEASPAVPTAVAVAPDRVLTVGDGASLVAPVEAGPDATFAWKRDGQTVFLSQSAEWPWRRVSSDLGGRYSVEVSMPGGGLVVGPFEVRPRQPSSGARRQSRWLAAGLPKPMLNLGATTATVEVPAMTIAEVRVGIDVLHADTNDLTIDLRAPDGTTVRLVDPDLPVSLRRGRNFDGTVFADDAPDRINDAPAPYVGVFRPSDPAGLAALAGPRPAGAWTLRIADTREDGNVGSLGAFVLELFAPAVAPSLATFAEGVLPESAPPAYEIIPGQGVRLTHWEVSAPARTVYERAVHLSPGWDPVVGPPLVTRRLDDQIIRVDLAPGPLSPAPDTCFWRVRAN